MMADATLDTIAAELYATAPDDFVKTRDARAKEASGADLTAAIKALRKPSVAAGVVNLFARERAEQLGEALQLAQELREAQADLDAATLAKLGRERRALTHRLAQNAAELARARGERITPSTLDAVQQTISAAFFDPDAAAAVASGRLVRELEPSATIDLSMVVAGGAPGAPVVKAAPADEVGARRRRREAEHAVREAEKARAQAEREQQKAEKAHASAIARAEELTARVAELEAELAQTRKDAEQAATDAAAADERRADAADDLAAAERAADEAQGALDQLD